MMKTILAKTWDRVRHYPHLGLVLLAYVAFIALGMPDGLMGVAWPSIRAGFGIPLDALGLMMVASTSGYLTSSFLSGSLLSRFGVGRLLVVSCALTGSALLGYTLVPTWGMMVLLGVASGLGAGAIDAGLNTYVAAHFGEGLMQWLHASYGVGVTLGPVIMTLALTRLNSWRVGYSVVAVVQFVLSVCFLLSLARWDRAKGPVTQEQPKRLTDYDTPMRISLGKARVWWSALLFFVYTGAEVALGAWSYSLLTEGRGIAPGTAGFFAGGYWAMFTLGRVLAGLFARRLGVHTLVLGGTVGALLGAALLWWNPTAVMNLVAVAVIGFSIAPIFPALVSGTSGRVGEDDAANTIGMQMAAAGLGAAAIPGLIGVLARRVSLEIIPICLLCLFVSLLLLYRLSMGRNHKPTG